MLRPLGHLSSAKICNSKRPLCYGIMSTKLGEGSGGRLRPPVAPGQSTTIGLSVRCQLTSLDCIYFINDLVII